MARPYRAGGDRGKMEFSMSEEQYDRIFNPTPAEETLTSGACPQEGGCAACPDRDHCRLVRVSVGLES